MPTHSANPQSVFTVKISSQTQGEEIWCFTRHHPLAMSVPVPTQAQVTSTASTATASSIAEGASSPVPLSNWTPILRLQLELAVPRHIGKTWTWQARHPSQQPTECATGGVLRRWLRSELFSRRHWLLCLL